MRIPNCGGSGRGSDTSEEAAKMPRDSMQQADISLVCGMAFPEHGSKWLSQLSLLELDGYLRRSHKSDAARLKRM